jgi:hypothetical protein
VNFSDNTDAVQEVQVLAEIADTQREVQTLLSRREAIASRPCDLPIATLTDRLQLISERLEYLEPLVIESNQLTQEIEHLKVALAQRTSLANELFKLDNRIELLERRIAIMKRLVVQSGLAIDFPTAE